MKFLHAQWVTIGGIMNHVNIPLICLTGGPCAGKTTALRSLDILTTHGYWPVFVPEAATLVFDAGILSGAVTGSSNIAPFQYQLSLLQLALEDRLRSMSRLLDSCNHSVLITDRGLMDNEAFFDSPEQHTPVLQRLGYTKKTAQQRYDAVFHLVSTAIGAEEYYTYNNPVRYETVKEAAERDHRIRAAWSGHPRLYVISNEENGKQIDFERKLNILCEKMLEFLNEYFAVEGQ